MALRRSINSHTITVLSCRLASSSSASNQTPALEKPAKDEIPVPKPVVPQLKREPLRNPNILNESFEAPGYHDYTLNRLYDYFKIGQIVRDLETPAARIKFVNPYERAWSRTEKKWHRVNHPNLYSPRKAWLLDAIPRYYDIERYYKFITKTRLPTDNMGKLLNDEERNNLWSECYKTLNLPSEKFEKRVIESLISVLDGADKFTQETSDKFLTQFLEHGQSVLSHNYNFIDNRISFNPRCESFWICAGFEELYRRKDMLTGELRTNRGAFSKYTGDHREKLGELAFTMRDKLLAQIRQRKPLASINLDQFENSFQHEESFEDLILPPWIYNLDRYAEILWQCPGYEPESGEQHPYSRLIFKNIHELNDRIDLWGMKDDLEIQDTRLECMRATAISTLFNCLNGQAHCAGYTQYTDDGKINRTSQLVLADGKQFFFAIGQLRNIAFNINWDLIGKSNPDRVHLFPERNPNLVLYTGPYNLFEEYNAADGTFKHLDEKTRELKSGLNPVVLQNFLNMLIVK